MFSCDEMKKIKIFTDGGCHPNPGKMGIGVVIKNGRDVIKTISEPIGMGTNNIAEYRAVIRALEEAKKMNVEEIELYSDSQLIISQINGDYSVKNKGLKPLYSKVMKLKKFFKTTKFKHIKREKNKFANRLSIQGSHSF